MFIGDNAFFLWLIEGDRFIRDHSGFCYTYNGNGAFQPYSGIPPQSVLFRVCAFFTHLEGIFHRMSPSTPKTEEGILRAIAADLARFETEDLFLESCTKAAVNRRIGMSLMTRTSRMKIWMKGVRCQVRPWKNGDGSWRRPRRFRVGRTESDLVKFHPFPKS